MSKIRIDQYLSSLGFASSRTHAASLIEQGQVELWLPVEGSKNLDCSWIKIKKPSIKVLETMKPEQVRVTEGPANRFVSRGGLKLEGALNYLNFSVKNLRVLDIGVSTGGFSDCCLQREASQVVGIDVGHGQISSKLNKYSQFIHFEGINAKNLLEIRTEYEALSQTFDLIIGDISFISVTKVLSQLPPFLLLGGHILFLIKPQFELDSSALNKNGIVKDPHSYDIVKDSVLKSSKNYGFKVLDYFDSVIEGKDGNKEFFLFGKVDPNIT